MTDRISPCTDEWADLLAGYPDELSPSDRMKVKNHLASCAACRAVYAQYQAISQQLRSFPVLTKPIEFPPELQRLLDAQKAGADPVGAEAEPEVAERQLIVQPEKAPAYTFHMVGSVAQGYSFPLRGLVPAASGPGDAWDDDDLFERRGWRFGTYRLIARLGVGGKAEVYLGEHLSLRHRVAIKVLHMARLTTERQIDDFSEEARALVNLVHPHLVRVLDFGVTQSIPYLVMEYAPGGTLRQRHPRGERLDPARIVSYTRQCANALNILHQQKIIHRNLEPENVLIGQNQQLLLSDFGLTRLTASMHYPSRNSAVLNKIMYMAPEQIEGKAQPASDQYALGVMVYEWLTGDIPFAGLSLTEAAIQQVIKPPPPLRERAPGISREVEGVVLKALAKKPEARFPTILAFADALEAALVQRPAHTRKTGQQWVKEAEILASTRRYEEAFLAFQRAIEEDVNYTPAYLRKGILLNELKRYQEAVETFQQYLRLNPHDAEAYQHLRVTFMGLKDYDQALDASMRAVSFKPADPLIHLGKGDTHIELKQWNEAEESYSMALHYDPNAAPAYSGRAWARYQRRRYEDALQDCERAIQRDPAFAQSHNIKGLALWRLQRPAEALVAFQQAIQWDPRLAAAYTNKGQVLAEQGHHLEALAAYQLATARNPDSEGAWRNMAHILKTLDQDEQAEAASNTARALREQREG